MCIRDRLEGSGMEYVIEQKTVVIKKKVNSPSEKSKSILLKGFVTDRQKHPLPGVTVKLIAVSYTHLSLKIRDASLRTIFIIRK